MFFFYSPNCNDCQDIKTNILPGLNSKYADLLEIRYFDIHNLENFKLMLNLEKKYKTLEKPPPSVFIGEIVLDGNKEVRKKLEQTIKFYLNKGGCGWPGENILTEKKPKTILNEGVIEKFKYLGIIAIIGAGLFDGINPCAFSTIIIFVLYLSFTGYKKREILGVGLIFAFAVFLAYFFIGIGLFEVVRQIKFLPLVNRIVNFIFGIVSIILGLLSLYDFYKIHQGKLKEITLQLPESFKERIKTLIWKKTNKKNILLSAFIIGFIIGFIEFPCTGQIYFPIIIVMREMAQMRLQALFYLLIYNFMFIVPLIIVFSFVFWGTTSDGLIKIMNKYSGMVKIFLAILFFVLGIILFVL